MAKFQSADRKILIGPELLTVSQAASKKGVSRTAIYAAVRENRLQVVRTERPMLLSLADVVSWEPVRYGERIGKKHPGRLGQSKVMSKATRQKISEGQKRRWATKKSVILEQELLLTKHS